ncbi:uncharacterized protein LOC111708627 [Eurytemora carolleeae]|uniref:uncharacterized protein LOC111708627 n=1 Tax=Eurytemora carolleeae TaxID=1294199 RepID=UPI000C776663|nr:uncharacterized protein LOC111708627 [Eurytemora carolleeae]|eukprot:XP_023337833.1 uncharacterized protein LOC111708627 [Eurytemora affinis]
MVEIYNLPSYYHVSTTCITRLVLAKLILFYSFFTEPWFMLTGVLSSFIRSIPGLVEISPPPLLTPLLSAEIMADTLVMMGLCWKSRMCMIPWLFLNMLGILATSLAVVNKVSVSDEFLKRMDGDLESIAAELHLMVCVLCLVLLLCTLSYQYSCVLDIYFHIHRSSNFCIREKEGSVQGKVENGNVYSPVLTGNVFSDTGFYSTATETASFYDGGSGLIASPTCSPPLPCTSAPSCSQTSSFITINPTAQRPVSSHQTSFHYETPSICTEENRKSCSFIEQNTKSSSLLEQQTQSSCIDGGSSRNSLNTFKFSFDDENFT